MKSGYISIIGRPNSGKSALLNNILGESLSIVTHKEQTTRHRILGIHNEKSSQMIFLDTPGYHKSEKTLNKYMMDIVGAAVKDADLILWVVDLTGDDFALPDYKNLKPENTIIVLNKIDRVLARPWESVADEFRKKYEGYRVLAVSAVTGTGVNELLTEIAEGLPEGEPFYPDDIYTELPVRFLVSEIVREQIILQMHEEIPYSVAVEIINYKEEPTIHKIEAAIIVDKDSQKGMLIGKGGERLKKIGTEARKKIQDLVGTKVFLKLFVKVEKNWTKDPARVRELMQQR